MKTLALALLLLMQSSAVVETIEFSGISEGALSSSIQTEIQKFKGQPYRVEEAQRLVGLIKSGTPGIKSAEFKVENIDASRVRIVFTIKRYVVDSIEILGVEESVVSMTLLQGIRSLAGQALNEPENDRLRAALSQELGKDFGVTWKTSSTGSEKLKLIFDAFHVPWLPFREPKSFLSYHPKLNLSFAALPSFWDDSPDSNLEFSRNAAPSPTPRNSIKHVATKKFIFGFANNGDDLIERYKGFLASFEARRAGTSRLGLRLEWSAYGSRWKTKVHEATSVLPDFDLYRARHTLAPSAALALTRDAYVTVGARWVDLDMPNGNASRAANAVIGGVHLRHTFSAKNRDTHDAQFDYDVTAATNTLDSDYVYTRHQWNAVYTFLDNPGSLSVKISGGKITGTAPLFERFSLGNTETLRGWSRIDIAPRGGDRMVHSSIEWAYKLFYAFYDAGSVWDSGNAVRVRSSIGLAAGSSEGSGLILAFRIENARLRPMLMLKIK